MPLNGKMRYIKLAYKHYRPYAVGCALICLGMALQTGFRVALPIGYQHLFDTAVMKEGTHTLSGILSLLLAGWVIYVIAGGLFAYYSVRVGLCILGDIRAKMFRQLQRLSESYFSDSHSGDLMSRFTNDLAVVEKVLVRNVYTAVFSVVLLLVSLFTLFFIEWRLATITFAMLALALLGPRVLGRWSHEKNLKYQKQQGKVASMVSESIGGQAIVRAFDLRDFRFSHFREQQGVLTDRGTLAYFSGSLVGLSSSMTVLVVQIAIMGIGAFLVSSAIMTPGDLVGFIALLLTIGNASNYLSQVSPELLQGSVSVQRIQEFLGEETAEIEKSQHIDLEMVVGNVRFEEVSFSYDESIPALHDLNFEIQAGESVAVVGPSGSGKSTVLQLLLRSYKPRVGRITLDDYDLCEITEGSLRNRIGYVPQESVLFSTSLMENIRMGDLEASDDQVVEAAKLAEIHDAIMTMPDQYHTVVGERGSRLSGGQRQRIALARALLRKPDVLLLDEATSALDPATEQAINRTLDKLKGTCMVISATHRLQGLVNMDRILVMDQGAVVEDGLHKQLLERKGLYYKLWLKQSGFTISEDGYRAACEPERLKKIPLFAKVCDISLHKISDALVSEFYPKDRLVFSQGDPGDKFYILVHGGVVVEMRKASYRGPISVHLDDGDIFGEMALLHEQPRNATVRTTRPTLLLSLDRQQFCMLLEEEPSLKAAIEEVAQARRSQNNRNSYLELAAG